MLRGYPPPGAPPPTGQGYPPPAGQGYPPPAGQGYPPAAGQGYPPAAGQGYPPPAGGAGYPPQSAQTYQQAPGPAPGPAPGQGMSPWRPGQGGAAHQWDNLPQQPLPDAGQGPPQMGPPPPGYMQQFQGYDGVGGFGQMAPLPPPPPPPPPSGEPPKHDFGKAVGLTEEACKEAMLQFASENCCYGKGAAQDQQITSIKPTNALHYTLESFTEGRSHGYAHEPYQGQPIDGPELGYPPGPWQIQCVANNMFESHVKKFEVPHTAYVKPCHACESRGFNRCWRCHGMGHNQCSHCHGSGRKRRQDADGGEHWDNCFSCGGDGRQRCHTCGGDGRITCDVCDGFRSLKCFIQVTVSFTNHLEDHILEETDMPDELVRNVKGETMFEQVLPQVWPIVAFPVQEINDNSIRLVESHRQNWPTDRILNQRQRLRAVAVTEVAYKFKDTESRYWVYGQECKVHCPDYPQTCCWGCNIL